jgi:hypothetical protein
VNNRSPGTVLRGIDKTGIIGTKKGSCDVAFIVRIAAFLDTYIRKRQTLYS